jgi:iron(III) transport system ATP-binding protein
MALPAGWASIEARLERVEFLGALTRLDLVCGSATRLRGALLDVAPDALQPGATLSLAYDPAAATVFPAP